MIDFDHVVKQYGKSNVRAVDDLTLHVGKGQLFGFIGPNGAGKTTTIRLLTGILQPTSGSVTIGGVSMKDDPIAAKRMIGFVPDSHELYDRLTGMEYLNFMADVYGVGAQERKAHIEKYLALFELENAAGEQIKSYSRGMKQKLTIIGALVHQPPVWVLDEPMVGLDPARRTSSRKKCASTARRATRFSSPRMCWRWRKSSATRLPSSTRDVWLRRGRWRRCDRAKRARRWSSFSSN